MDFLGLVLLIVAFAAVLPIWPYSKQWGRWPMVVVGFFFVALITALLYHALHV